LLGRNWLQYTTGSPFDLSLAYHLDPIRERRQSFADKPERIIDILHEGSRRARAVAAGTMDEVRRAVRLTP
jgi:tryptophanyl-tRNA synthetase